MPIVAGECRHRGREDGEELHQCVTCLESERGNFNDVRIKVVPSDGQGPALWLKPSEVYLTQ